MLQITARVFRSPARYSWLGNYAVVVVPGDAVGDPYARGAGWVRAPIGK